MDFFHFTFYTLMLLVITGGIVGFLLALTGGGGSIVCVPLLLYMVQIPDTHLVIGTSAMSVAVSALLNLFAHAAKGNVRWRTGIVVSLVAVAGTLAGSQMGKITDGRYLTLPFALLMLIVAGLTLKKNHRAGNGLASPDATFHPAIVWLSVLALGAVAGFLGIGGGFLAVPALLWFFRFSLLEAVATSLVVVSAMGLSTSASYALSGKVSLVITCWLIVGGVLGGVVGVALTERLKKREDIIRVLYAAMLLVLALYMLFKSL
ncbi:sulfite exporter TauE/SafE family protein [Serratia ureilytica]|uniref:sulfite exporter TauE/SafE family protein n=1 Tax=Serratia ureilytica TaxID=300181 RepID=UPI0018D5C0AD|nr:sulfite exporter TauE/SafE family protein [Serratia ureilytica]MBH3023803.1 sulfite exporter TauE/SafE family protein [Serratia ureilytica]MBJ2111776.1 sulfite exporter TauE/SafE family protein [Serratia ureilytica]